MQRAVPVKCLGQHGTEEQRQLIRVFKNSFFIFQLQLMYNIILSSGVQPSD